MSHSFDHPPVQWNVGDIPSGPKSVPSARDRYALSQLVQCSLLWTVEDQAAADEARGGGSASGGHRPELPGRAERGSELKIGPGSPRRNKDVGVAAPRSSPPEPLCSFWYWRSWEESSAARPPNVAAIGVVSVRLNTARLHRFQFDSCSKTSATCSQTEGLRAFGRVCKIGSMKTCWE